MLSTNSSRAKWERALVLAALLTTGALGWSNIAHADQRTDARRYYMQGMKLVMKGEYEAGIAKLQMAYDTLPHPNVLYNIAKAYVEAGEYDKALTYFEKYLASGPDDQEEVQKIVQKLRRTLDRQRAAEAALQEQKQQATGKQPSAPAGEEKKAKSASSESTSKPSTEKKQSDGGKPEKSTSKPSSTEAAAGLQPEKIEVGNKGEDIYEETTVTASRGGAQSSLDAPNATAFVTSQDIHLSGITKIPELLRRVAGVDVMEITGGDTNVSIRGFNSRLSNKVLVLVNGRSVYIDALGATFWDMLPFDVDDIERIEVVRGPGSALYGADAFSGVINIITRKPGEGKNHVRMGLGDHMQSYASTAVTGRSGSLGYRMSAGYTRYPRWSRMVGPDRVDVHVLQNDQTTASENFRVNLDTTRRLAKNVHLDMGGGYARGTLEVSGIGVFYDMLVKPQWTTAHAKLRTKHLSARVFFNRLEAHPTGMNANYIGQTLYTDELHSNTLDGELEFNQAFKLGSSGHNDFHAGINYRMKDIDWVLLGTHREHHGAIFMEDSYSPVRWLKLVGSARLDYNPYLENLQPSPRLALILHPTARSAVRLSAGTSYRKPAFMEAYPGFGLQLPVTGLNGVYDNEAFYGKDYKLKPERLIAFELGYLNQDSDYFEWDMAAYWQKGTDFIDGAPFPLATPSDVANGKAGLDPQSGRYDIAYGGLVNECATRYIYGGEASLRVYPITGLDLFANYALTLDDLSKPEGCFAKAGGWQSTHKVNAGVQVRTNFGVNGEVSYSYQSPQDWTEMVASLGSTGDVTYETKRIDAYSLLNARIGYTFLQDRAEVSATAFNLLNHKHQQHPLGQLVGRRFMGFLAYKF